MLCVAGPRQESCEALTRWDSAHGDRSRIKTDLWELPVIFIGRWRHNLHLIKQHYFWRNHFLPFLSRALGKWVGRKVCLSVCFGFNPAFKHLVHIATVPACSSGTLINVLSHRNAMPQTQDMKPHPVTVYRHWVELA